MGKIFSVEIEYGICKHKALVSVCYLNEEPVFHVQLMDTFLREIFGQEHIRYRGLDGYHYCDIFEDELSMEIIDRIGTAIENKLANGKALIRAVLSWTMGGKR